MHIFKTNQKVPQLKVSIAADNTSATSLLEIVAGKLLKN